MTLSYEALLILGVIGFYLYDSAVLLYGNELVFWEVDGRWGFTYPESRWQLLGKNPYVPNPFRPDAAVFRVCWPTPETGYRDEERTGLRDFMQALNSLRYMAALLFILLLVGLPMALVSFGMGAAVLAMICAIYSTVAVTLFLVYGRRHTFGLSGKAFAGLAFELIACAPFAINVVRKLTLRHHLAEDIVNFGRETFRSDRFERLVDALCKRVEEEMALEDEGSLRFAVLVAYRERLGGTRI